MKKVKFNYVVIRHCVKTLDTSEVLWYNAVCLDSFSTWESADNRRGEFEQEAIDAGRGDLFYFEVQVVSHYNE